MLSNHIFYEATPRDHAIRLMDIGMKITGLARELHEQFPAASEKSLHTMVDNMLKGRDFYPRHALYLNTKYGFRFTRPDHKRPARQLLKAA